VPTLVHDGRVIVESTVINEYLDEVFPEVSLKPNDPQARATMRVWTKAVDEVLHPACAEVTFSSWAAAERVREIPGQYAVTIDNAAVARAPEGTRHARV